MRDISDDWDDVVAEACVIDDYFGLWEEGILIRDLQNTTTARRYDGKNRTKWHIFHDFLRRVVGISWFFKDPDPPIATISTFRRNMEEFWNRYSLPEEAKSLFPIRCRVFD